MISLVKSTSVCPICGQLFHQIDSTETRAVEITRAALARHIESEHADV